jgi:hypothetical protein
MEAFAVTRSYYNYEDSYTKVIAICYTEDKCKEIIEKDSHKHDHPLMDMKTYYDEKDEVREALNTLCEREEHCPKRGGFLNKFHYEQLNKTRRNAYNILKEKYDGLSLNSDVICSFSKEDRFYLMQLTTRCFSGLTYEQYEELNRHYSSVGEHPNHIHYSYEKFEVQ